MKFKYKAKTKDGEMQVGFVEAGSRNSASNILAGHDLFILTLESAEKTRWYDLLLSYFNRVRRKDMVIFTRQLAVLLEARLPLNAALRSLYEQTGNKTLRDAIFQMAEDIDAGLSFSQTMERQGQIFPEFYVEMVRAAEITGNLNEISGFLADYTEKESVLVNKAISAMIYPIILSLLFLVVAGIMLVFVFPQIKPIFVESGVDLPILTKILLGSGDFVTKWWFILAIVGAAFIGIFFEYIRTDEGRALFDDAKIKLPLVNKIYLPIVISRFSSAATLLIHGGIPIAQALEIIGHMVGNVLYRDIMHEVAEDLRQGELLSKSIAKFPDYFPPLVSHMIAVGETTGRIEQIFSRLSTFYAREADDTVGRIVDLVQPILLIIIGVSVGLLFAAILMPIFKLTQSIH